VLDLPLTGMVAVVYIGTDPPMQGTYLAQGTAKPGIIKVQADSVDNRMAHGWHEVKASDFDYRYEQNLV
jgi:hypothetical protein